MDGPGAPHAVGQRNALRRPRRHPAPDTREGLATEGRLLFRDEAWGQALEVFGDLVDLDPENPVWRCWRGLVTAQLGMTEEAARELADSVPQLSGLIDADHDDVALVALRGLAHAALGNCKAAIADLDAAARARTAGASEFLARGRCHAVTGNAHQAIADYTQVLDLNPSCAAALYERARVYVAADRLRDAVADLDRAVELRPDQVAYRQERADTNAALGEYLLAAHDLTIAIEAQPDATDLYRKRGELSYRAAYHGQTRDYGPAIEDYGRVIQNAPDNADAWYLRGRAHWQMAEETGSPGARGPGGRRPHGGDPTGRHPGSLSLLPRPVSGQARTSPPRQAGLSEGGPSRLRGCTVPTRTLGSALQPARRLKRPRCLGPRAP